MATKRGSRTGGGPGTNQYGVKGASRARPAPGRTDTFATPPATPAAPAVDLQRMIDDVLTSHPQRRGGPSIGNPCWQPVLDAARTTPLPELTATTSKAFMVKIASALDAAGLPPTLREEITGFTEMGCGAGSPRL